MKKELEEKLYQHAEYERKYWIKKQHIADESKGNIDGVHAAIEAENAYQRYDSLHHLIVSCGLEKNYKDWRNSIEDR